MRNIFRAALLGCLALCWTALYGQNSKTLPSDPKEFIRAFSGQLTNLNGKEVQEWVKGFEERWNGNSFTAAEKDRMITHTNLMLLKNYALNGEVLTYMKLIEQIKDVKNFGKLNLDEFYSVTDSCILLLDRKSVSRFYGAIGTFVTTGAGFQTSNSAWLFTEPSPRLYFGSVEDKELGKTVQFPALSFPATDIKFKTVNDSTIIHNTHGDLNLLNRVFKADGGRIDWSKMKLDPGDVYADLDEFFVNMNYTYLIIDTVQFHYNSLLGGKVLKGRFEDNNKGYRDINRANYPYFRSYDGGVVIENLIPNVRYEGGFSLRGIKKIGSAYYEWVEKKEENIKQDEAAGEEGKTDEELDQMYEELGFNFDSEENPFLLDGEEVVEEEDAPEWDAESGTAPGEFEETVFDDIDPDLLNKELVLMKARLILLRKGVPAMKLMANEFVLDLKRLVSTRTECVVYTGKEDSITHPSLDVLYLVDSNEVVLSKDPKDKMSRQPFYSPYHQYFVYFDALRWKQNTDKIEFTFLIDKENELGAIESNDFFVKQRWDQFKGVVPFHPIGAIYRYATEVPNTKIFAEDVVKHVKADKGSIEAFQFALADLEGSGFVDWDPKTGEIKPLPKLFDWAKAARGKKDYDAIQILSQVKAGNNAELNLETQLMKLEGVKFFSLSDSQFIRVLPFKEKVNVLKNRDLEFGGVVAAGKLNFYGIKPDMFRFEYENFKIKCDSLDSLRFVLVRDPPLGFEFSPLQKALRATSIEGVTGAIYINRPDNKNALERHPEYSVFDSYTQSYVYWAKGNIHGGVYAKDKLYFAIDPFVLDSLETFDESKLSFEGEFYSSEILPKIKQKLTVMDDYTLGFVQVAPPDTGYKVYDGKGKFTNGAVQMDGSGLKAKGQMDFLNTTAKADSFKMFFDSVNAITREFYMPEGKSGNGHFPELKAGEVNYKWLTKKDQIELSTLDNKPITMFGGEGTFEGKLVITAGGLKGKGKLKLVGGVTVESDDFIFDEKSFQANNGTFALTDQNSASNDTLLVSRGVNIQYDVAAHHSTYQAVEQGKPNTEFKKQGFATSLGKGEYDRKAAEVKFEAFSVKQQDNYFVATAADKDSLNFFAKAAKYALNTQNIDIEGVPYIYVADAKITPDKEQVGIRSDGSVRRLTNAVIEADLKSKYHRIYDGAVDVLSAFKYEGKGKYDYVDVGGKPQYINMSKIEVSSDTVTTATGVIPDSQKFYLTDRIFFRGETRLQADKKYMFFKGEVKIESSNPFFKDSWIGFESEVNPDSVFIEINPDKMKGLAAGLHFVPQYRAYYSTFLQPKKNAKDKDVLLAGGGLTFDRNTQEFRIGPKSKLTGQGYKGNTSSFNDTLNIITTTGIYDFPFNFGKNTINMQWAGSWRDDMKQKEISTHILSGFDFSVIPKEAWVKFAEKVKLTSALNADVDFSNRTLIESLAEFLDKDKPDEKNTQEFMNVVKNTMVVSDIKVAKNLPFSLLLSDVKFKYSTDYKTLYANGDVGILGINGETINKMSSTNTKIEYSMGKVTPSGVSLSDTLNIYLEVDEFNWVYFRYYDDVLRCWSSDLEGFNAVLAAEIAKRKKNEGFRFELVDDMAKEEFLSRFVRRYIFTD